MNLKRSIPAGLLALALFQPTSTAQSEISLQEMVAASDAKGLYYERDAGNTSDHEMAAKLLFIANHAYDNGTRDKPVNGNRNISSIYPTISIDGFEYAIRVFNSNDNNALKDYISIVVRDRTNPARQDAYSNFTDKGFDARPNIGTMKQEYINENVAVQNATFYTRTAAGKTAARPIVSMDPRTSRVFQQDFERHINRIYNRLNNPSLSTSLQSPTN